MAELAQAEDITLEISIYGGALMLLVYDARETTKDVDAIFHPPEVARRLVAKVAREKGWDEAWLNDDVRFFVSQTETRQPWALLGPEFKALKLTRPTAKYLLALKVMACRRALPGYPGDEVDIGFLVRKMQIHSIEEIQEIVDRYFPDTVLPPTTVSVIEGILRGQAK